jgi:CHAD domain-containing protein
MRWRRSTTVNPVPTTSFIVPETTEVSALLASLAGSCSLEEDGGRSVRRRHFDTFDWRLHAAGLTLAREDGRWELRPLDAADVVATEAVRGGPWPRFADDFPAEGDLRPRLRKLLKMRALLHLITLRGERRQWRLLNRDRKTVARLALETVTLEKPERPSQWQLLQVQGLRGYEEVATAAIEAASTAGLNAVEAPPLDEILRAADLDPEGYSSRFEAALDPSQSALEAAAIIGRTLLRTLVRNEAGVKADVDTEFLHDFRVAVRRTRSALTHFKGVFAPEALAPFGDDLRSLGRLTGPLRDLDVHLLDEARYRALIPADLQPGLDPLFARLRTERTGELHRVRRALGDPEYRRFVRAWQEFLDDPPPGPRAATPVGELVARRLHKRHRRVVRDGRAIGPDSPPEALHRLRIECKKLRYLLEFAASLYPPGEVAALIKRLKGLQDNLGEYNDLSVQHARLRDDLAAVRGRGRSIREQAAAIGGLITALDARQAVVRDEFAAAFAGFTTTAVNRSFKRLAAGPPSAQEGGP